MKVINFWAGPGSGKSTNAKGLSYMLSRKGIRNELVTEYAKDMVWREMPAKAFRDQFYISAKQNHRLERLRGKMDFVVTDSPLLQGLMYMPEDYYPTYGQFLREVYDSYDNVNIFIRRTKDFDPVGRNQTEEEAKEIDAKILEFLDSQAVPYTFSDSFSAADYAFDLLT